MTALVACLGLAASGQARADTVVEYYNAALDHYFITPLANEIDDLDPAATLAGRARDWCSMPRRHRGGDEPGLPVLHSTRAWRFAFPVGVCRRMAAVRAKITTDPNYSGYLEETAAEFYIALPNTSTGACPAGTNRCIGCGTAAPTRIIATRPMRRRAPRCSRAATSRRVTERSVSRCARRARGSRTRRCASPGSPRSHRAATTPP